MNTEELSLRARESFQSHLAENPYPGRGLVIGRSPYRNLVIVYWIMGRSPNSRNRVFVESHGVLRTEAADPSQVEEPSLIIYNAIRATAGGVVVTNGSHTDRICEGLENAVGIQDTLSSELHEPDGPNFTPRIAGFLDTSQAEASAMLALVRCSSFTSGRSEHHFYHYPLLQPGFGYGVTTYLSDGNPLPSFNGPPLLLPLEGNALEIASMYWNALDENNRVALAVRETGPNQDAPLWEIINAGDRKNAG